eukprot:scaffold90724_cov35-Tisochrysis_lutea.AAC.1
MTTSRAAKRTLIEPLCGAMAELLAVAARAAAAAPAALTAALRSIGRLSAPLPLVSGALAASEPAAARMAGFCSIGVTPAGAMRCSSPSLATFLSMLSRWAVRSRPAQKRRNPSVSTLSRSPSSRISWRTVASPRIVRERLCCWPPRGRRTVSASGGGPQTDPPPKRAIPELVENGLAVGG